MKKILCLAFSIMCYFTSFSQQLNSESTWIGSQLFYNLDGSSLDNVVGSAKIKLNTVEKWKDKKFNLNVIGNISKFSGSIDKNNIERDLREISQSEQGLILGLEPLYKIMNLYDLKLQLFGGLVYKLNHFQNIDTTNSDAGLSQGRLSFGVQFEGLKFSDGESLLHLSVETGVSLFDESKFTSIFREKRSSLAFVETTFIMPLFGRFGLLLKHTVTQYTSPVFAAGIIIRNE